MKIMIRSFLLIMLFTGCWRNYYDTRLTFINNSQKSIYVSISDIYKDTNYVFVNYNPANMPNEYKILPNETKVPIKPIGSWEKVYSNQSKLSFYVFDAQIMETIPWDTIKAKYLVLKRYDLSLKDLQQMNWTIIYP